MSENSVKVGEFLLVMGLARTEMDVFWRANALDRPLEFRNKSVNESRPPSCQRHIPVGDHNRSAQERGEFAHGPWSTKAFLVVPQTR